MDGHGITISADMATERKLVCEAARGRALRLVYRTPEGETVELPPCVSFEILHIDQDGASLVPDMLDPAPVARVSALEAIDKALAWLRMDVSETVHNDPQDIIDAARRELEVAR